MNFIIENANHNYTLVLDTTEEEVLADNPGYEIFMKAPDDEQKAKAFYEQVTTLSDEEAIKIYQELMNSDERI